LRSRPFKSAWVLPILGLISALIGCVARCPERWISREELVGEYNANAEAVPRLWARAKIAVAFTTGDGWPVRWGSTSALAGSNGLLLLVKGDDPDGPHDFLLRGVEAGNELFRVGSSTADGVYYFAYRLGQEAGAWFGRNELAGAPGVEEIPIDPNQLLSVLGIVALPADFTRLPTVVMTLSNDPCAYVLSYLARQPITGKILFRREVFFRWSDRQPRRPFRVNLFDGDGRRVMTAELKKYRKIQVPGLPVDRRPVMPTDIEIRWPEKKSRVHIVLSEMTAEPRGSRAACRFFDDQGRPRWPGRIVAIDAAAGMKDSSP